MENEKMSNVFSAFEETAHKQLSKTAVIYLGTKYSYGKLLMLARQFATALISIGVRPEEKVILYIPNSIQWVVTWLGIQRADAVCVPITPIYTPHDLEYIANNSGARTIICADTNFGYVKRVISKTDLKRTIITKQVDLLPWWKRWFGYLFDIIPKGKISLDENIYSFRSLLKKSGKSQLPEIQTDGGAIAEIMYTGGTTKFPKGVPMSHDLFLDSAKFQILMSEPLIKPENNTVLGNAPLFHILGQTCGFAALLVGGTLMIMPRMNLDAAFDAIERFKVTAMIGVPMLYRMILEHERLDQYDLSSVKYWFSGGDVLPVELGNRWKKKFGTLIYQGYGATETCGGVAMCPVDIENPPKSIGRVMPIKEIKIVDPMTFEPVPIGEPGELLVHSKYMVTEYFNKPEETADSFIDLDGKKWYRTADILSMDEDGNLYFIDRTVDTIKHKGYRVSASEIEAVLQEHPAVIDTCVVGIPDEKTGERIKAYVVLKDDIKGITGYELMKWCRKTLASYKIPQYIEFRDMLPKSKVGKLLRREIRKEEKQRVKA